MDNNVQINAQIKDLGTKLCTIRKSLGLTHEHMAECFNTDRRNISAIELGESKNFDLICKYSEKFDIDLALKIDVG